MRILSFKSLLAWGVGILMVAACYLGVMRTGSKQILVLTKDSPFFNGVCDGIKKAARSCPSLKIKFMYIPPCADKTIIRQITEEALNKRPALIIPIGVTLSQECISLAQKRKTGGPVLFVGPGDPVNQGLVSSLDKRIEAVTGVSLSPLDYSEPPALLLHCYPTAKNILLPHFPNAAGGLVGRSADLVAKYLESHGCRAVSLPLYSLADIQEKIKPHLNTVDVVMYLEGCFLSDSTITLIKHCDQHQVPLFAGDLQAVEDGAAFGYGVSAQSLGEKAIEMANDILIHKKSPGEMPVKFMHESRKIALNRAAAVRQRLFISSELLKLAHEKGVIHAGK